MAKYFELPAPGPWSYEQQHLCYNYRMADLQVAFGLSQLQRLNPIVEERQRLLKIPQAASSSLHLAVIRLADPSQEHHLSVFVGLEPAGIAMQLQPYYRRRRFREVHFPEAEVYASNVITLRLYPDRHVGDQQRVADTLTTLIKP